MSRHQSDRSAVDIEERVDRYQEPNHHFVAIEGSFGALRKHRSSDLNVRTQPAPDVRSSEARSPTVAAGDGEAQEGSQVQNGRNFRVLCEAFAFAAWFQCLPIGFRVCRPETPIFPSSFAMPRHCLSVGIEDHGCPSHIDVAAAHNRYGQRAFRKKNRRNRHHEKPFIRDSLTQRWAPARCNIFEGTEPHVFPDAPDTAP